MKQSLCRKIIPDEIWFRELHNQRVSCIKSILGINFSKYPRVVNEITLFKESEIRIMLKLQKTTANGHIVLELAYFKK